MLWEGNLRYGTSLKGELRVEIVQLIQEEEEEEFISQ